jgi:hypothetical protein
VSALEERTARGVALLDRRRPGWRDRTDPGRLAMQEPQFAPGGCGCLLAQTSPTGSYWAELDALINETDPDGSSGLSFEIAWAADHGFNLTQAEFDSPQHNALWAALTQAWRAVLAP